MNSLLKYTNGTGHLVMSLACLVVGLCLVLFSPDAGTKATGTTIILTVFGAWFIPGAAKQVAHEVANQLIPPAPESAQPPADPDATAKMPAIKVQ